MRVAPRAPLLKYITIQLLLWTANGARSDVPCQFYLSDGFKREPFLAHLGG